MMFRWTIAMAFVLGLLISALSCLVWLLCRLVSRCFDAPAVPFAPFGWTALCLVIALLAVMFYGYKWGRFQQQTTHTTYSSPALPSAFNGYKIVHISDLHLATFANHPEVLQRMIDTINAQSPDLICFTGDLVSLSVAEAEPFTSILRTMHATDGVMSVLGNHDLFIYSQRSDAEREAEITRLEHFERDTLGWHLLRNQSRVITRNEQTITILGVDNSSCDGQGFRTVYRGNLPQALSHTEGFRILLSHDPTQWEAEIIEKTDIPLTLSGHTHAGQVRLFGHPLSDIMFRESAGWYHTPLQTTANLPADTAVTQSIYVNQGVGCTVPIRIGCPAEITVITLSDHG